MGIEQVIKRVMKTYLAKNLTNKSVPTFYQYNLSMLGKVRLRRNDFLCFQPQLWSKNGSWLLRLDYLPVLS